MSASISPAYHTEIIQSACEIFMIEGKERWKSSRGTALRLILRSDIPGGGQVKKKTFFLRESQQKTKTFALLIHSNIIQLAFTVLCTILCAVILMTQHYTDDQLKNKPPGPLLWRKINR